MALTAQQFAQQIVAQLRILDPSASAEVGTPERKLIDSVAQSLAANQVDSTGLSSGLNINSKVGSNLDSFTAMFGMARQAASAATGYVVFSRNTPAPAAISVNSGLTIQSSQTNANYPTVVQYTTQATGTIAQGETASAPVPVQCVVVGSAGNVDANTLTQVVGDWPAGVTAVTNAQGISNGTDAEDDNSFKTRFQNTWARNLAGTSSQYLAIALAGAFTTKANVIGNQSTYQEYIQVPTVDDSNSSETQGEYSTYGITGHWTSAASDIAYAKQVYTTTPTFISDSNSYFYRSGIDYVFNANEDGVLEALEAGAIFGDAVRNVYIASVASAQTISSGSAINCNVSESANLEDFTSGYIMADCGGNGTVFSYSGINTSGSAAQFTGITVIGQYVNGVWTAANFPQTITASTPIFQVPSNPGPTWTFLQVFANETPPAGLQALTPGEVVLSQYDYISTASRNDLARNINNAVDIYVNGSNDVSSSTVFLPAPQQFVINPASAFFIENYRRDGEPATRPSPGNYFTPLYQSPIDSLPPTISINSQSYYLGYHYWLVHEVGPLEGSIRARDGIEWCLLPGDTAGGPSANPYAPYTPTPGSGSTTILDYANTGYPVEVDNYTYDSNIVTMQAATEVAKQITTDPLVHKALTRYFKFALTLIYSSQQTPSVVNSQIQTALQSYLSGQYYGSIIQLSSIIETVASVTGVQNVRWSNDLPTPTTQVRVIETDVNGNELAGASVQRWQYGGTSTAERQLLTISGEPDGESFLPTGNVQDYFQLTWSDPNFSQPVTTQPILFAAIYGNQSAAAGYIQTLINEALSGHGAPYSVTVQTQFWANTDGTLQFIITYEDGTPYLPEVTQQVSASSYTYDTDFFLLDDQLPSLPTNAATGDTVPGAIIQVRAQNTWLKSQN